MTDSDDIYEEDIRLDEPAAKKVKEDGSSVFCENCRLESIYIDALCLCYDCERYFCCLCFEAHDKSHFYVQKTQTTTEQAKSRRVTYIEKFRCRKLKNNVFEGVNSNTYNWQRTFIKHIKRDQVECDITGLCVYDNASLVIVDHYNDCLKILDLENFRIHRYIRFPFGIRDATQINLEGEVGHQGSKSKGNITESNKSDNKSPEQILVESIEKHPKNSIQYGRQTEHLLAVTLPSKGQIWLIDINNQPARKKDKLNIADGCLRVKFYSGKIFALCRGEKTVNSIHIMSMSGRLIKTIQTEQKYITNFDVLDGKVYLADYITEQVVCINVDDRKVISNIKIKDSGVDGICYDQRNNVYITAGKGFNIYKISKHLDRLEPIHLLSHFIDSPRCITFHDDKLFLTHSRHSQLGNYLTVIKLT